MDQRAVQGSEAILPSRGIVYDGKLPDGKVIVTPMTTREEKAIASGGQGGGLSTVDMLITRCVHGADGEKLEVTPDELVVGDRLYLMQAIRKVSLGSSYEFQIRCESCAKRFTAGVDVPDDLEEVTLPEGFIEPFEGELPESGIKLGLRLLRGRDQREIFSYNEKQYKKQKHESNPAYTYSMVKRVVWADVPEDYPGSLAGLHIEHTDPKSTDTLISLFENLHVMDTNGFRDILSNNDCGLNTEIEFNCPHCNVAFTQAMPMEVEFFRPGGRGKLRVY